MIQIALLEWKTLLKGFILSFFIVLPFTFIPLISSSERFIDRFPISVLYSVVFALFICLAALYHNYERQKFKLNFFSKPAFKHLNFSYQQTGKGSLVEDLGFQLAGFHKDIYYLIDMSINLDNYDDYQVLIFPIVPVIGNRPRKETMNSYKELLQRGFKCRVQNDQLVILLNPNEIKAEDKLAMTKILNRIDSKVSLILA